MPNRSRLPRGKPCSANLYITAMLFLFICTTIICGLSILLVVRPCLESNRRRRLREAALQWRAAKIIAVRRAFPHLRLMSVQEMLEVIDLDTYYEYVPFALIASSRQEALRNTIRQEGVIPVGVRFGQGAPLRDIAASIPQKSRFTPIGGG